MKYIIKLFLVASLMSTGFANAEPTLEERIQALEDMNEIHHLVIAAYATALDISDMQAFGALFTNDGEFSLGGIVIKGPEKIAGMFAGMGGDTPPDGAAPAANGDPLPLPSGVLPMPPLEFPMRDRMVPHVITNPSYVINGDTAEGTSYWSEIMLIEGRPGIVNMGHYEDKLIKSDGKWKFKWRKVVRDVPIGTEITPPPAP